MRIKLSAALRSIASIFVCVIFIYPQIPSENPAASDPEAPRKLLIISDNQEHLLTGVPLKSMSPLTERWITSVAMRSPLANVGGNLLFQEVLRFGNRESVDMTLHLGDASDISCPDELNTVFATLKKNMQNRWFMAMGNHDGILVGTHTKYQPPFEDDKKESKEDKPKKPSVYTQNVLNGHKGEARGWFNSCLSPKNEEKGDILTKEDAIKLYLEQITAREKDALVQVGTQVVTYKDEKVADLIKVDCTIKWVKLKSQNYSAVARVCPRTKIGNTKYWVGAFASYLVQRIDIGGNRILLLDTSDYINPNLRNVALSGAISKDQTKLAQSLLDTEPKMPREKTIIAGHHPIDDFREQWQKEWVLERASRYMSGHVHRSAELINHKIKKNSLKELNIGSTLDYPTQAVVANISAREFSFQVAGADVKKTNLIGFLEQCEENSGWRFKKSFYRGYARKNYISRVLNSLEKAAARHNDVVKSAAPIVIPKGNSKEDWAALEKVLETIRNSEDKSGMFWACQAYYASEATKDEKSVAEWFIKTFGLGTKSGDPAVGGLKNF